MTGTYKTNIFVSADDDIWRAPARRFFNKYGPEIRTTLYILGGSTDWIERRRRRRRCGRKETKQNFIGDYISGRIMVGGFFFFFYFFFLPPHSGILGISFFPSRPPPPAALIIYTRRIIISFSSYIDFAFVTYSNYRRPRT